MHLKKEDLKAKCFKTMLENGKKFIQQANEALLRMKLSKAEMFLEAPESELKKDAMMRDVLGDSGMYERGHQMNY